MITGYEGMYVIHFKQKENWELFQFYETLVWVNKPLGSLKDLKI